MTSKRGSDVRAGRDPLLLRVRRWWQGGALDDDFNRIEALLTKRTETLVHAMGRLQAAAPSYFKDDPDRLFRLAAIDVFVEKAQTVLTTRARRMSRAGFLTSSVAVGALIALTIYIARHGTAADITLTRNQLILRIVSAISLGAIVLVAVKYMIALARSFLHESVTLLSRRHSLRFGRLFAYMNPDDTDLDDLLAAFDWNRGGDSSFLDIRPGEIGQTPYSNAGQAVAEVLAKAFDEARDTMPRRQRRLGRA